MLKNKRNKRAVLL